MPGTGLYMMIMTGSAVLSFITQNRHLGMVLCGYHLRPNNFQK